MIAIRRPTSHREACSRGRLHILRARRHSSPSKPGGAIHHCNAGWCQRIASRDAKQRRDVNCKLFSKSAGFSAKLASAIARKKASGADEWIRATDLLITNQLLNSVVIQRAETRSNESRPDRVC